MALVRLLRVEQRGRTAPSQVSLVRNRNTSQYLGRRNIFTRAKLYDLFLPFWTVKEKLRQTELWL